MKERKPKPQVPKKADDPEQSERFIETARKLGADTDESQEALERLFKKAVPPKPKRRRS